MRFFLVDRVDEILLGERIRGIKCVTLTEEILQDHFPEHPVYPGTLLVEALAQLSGFLLESTSNQNTQQPIRRALLCQIEKAKFYEAVWPGDQLILEAQLKSSLDSAARFDGKITCNEKKIATATLLFTLKEIDSEKVHQQRRELYQIWTRKLKLDFPIR